MHPAVRPAPVLEGQVLAGKYRVEKVLGRGGMGVVVAATHELLQQRVALKFLLPDSAQGAADVERFLREARTATRIQSEHVARVLDVGVLDDGAPFIVMELLEGADLDELLHARGPLPVPDAVDYVLQACEALAEAHRAGIVHRDLKPGNLFLTARADGSPLVKVLDFGLSKLWVPGQEQLTHSAVPMGTPLYMSPEQIRDAKRVDARADVWAMGVTLFELVSGKRPFSAPTTGGVLAAVLTTPPLPLRSLRPDAPPALERLLERCLEKDLGRRVQDVAELAEALRPFAPPGAHPRIDRVVRILRGGPAAGAPLVADFPDSAPDPTTAPRPVRPAPPPASQDPAAQWEKDTPPALRRRNRLLALAAVLAASAMALGLAWLVGLWLRPPSAAPAGPSARAIALHETPAGPSSSAAAPNGPPAASASASASASAPSPPPSSTPAPASAPAVPAPAPAPRRQSAPKSGSKAYTRDRHAW